MKEIGGYIELDTYSLPMLHEGAAALNCGRNALAYLIEAEDIRKIVLPYFICSSVKKVCEKYSVKIRYYHILPDFNPDVPPLENDEWFYVVNYYGQVSREKLETLADRVPHIIIDNAQDYFAEPIKGADTLYTCRKYFGVPDGAFLYTNIHLKRELPEDESFERMHFLLGRYERNASEFYIESVMNNRFFETEQVKKMSLLTWNLLHAVNYEQVKRKRTENFKILSDALQTINRLDVRNVEGAFMYPLLLADAADIRRKMQEQKIYIPILWPNVLEDVPEEWLEWEYAQNILPLPVDQRYNDKDMEYIVEVLKNVSAEGA